MSDEGQPPHTAPLEDHLFDDVCGLSENAAHYSSPPSTSEFAEWTPSDLWFPLYQNLLQGPADAGLPRDPAQAHADALGQDRSQSSNASVAGTLSSYVPVKPASSDQIGGLPPFGSRCKVMPCMLTGNSEGSKDAKGFFSRTREKVKRWKNRTFAQQEANKAAQKRYRYFFGGIPVEHFIRYNSNCRTPDD